MSARAPRQRQPPRDLHSLGPGTRGPCTLAHPKGLSSQWRAGWAEATKPQPQTPPKHSQVWE